MNKALFAFAPLAALTMAAPASAALIEKHLIVTGLDATGPYSTLKFDFSVSFDNSSNFSSTTNGLVVLSATPNYSLKYSYNKAGNYIVVGTNVSDNSYLTVGAENTLGFFVNSISTAPYVNRIGYTNSSGAYYDTINVTVVDKSAVAPAVPEPATWALMILGFGAVGYSMRRRQKAVVRFA